MDERLISQALQDTARKDIPDDMNMWPEVQAQMGRMTRSAARSRVSWVAAAILTMLAVSVVAYAAAVLLQGGYLDPGMQGASEADLVTLLNQSQTIDGLTVTLNYAYADSNRISFDYASSGTAPLGTTYQFTGEKLTDSAGREFQSMFGGGGGGGGSQVRSVVTATPTKGGSGGGGGSEGGSQARSVVTATPSGGGGLEGGSADLVSYSMTQQRSYDASGIVGDVDQLSLRLEVSIQEYVAADQNADSAPVPGKVIGPFAYDFTIPFIQGQVVEPRIRVVTNGQSILLERLVIAPSFTRGLVCFDPIPEASFAPLVSLTIDGEDVLVGELVMFAPAKQAEQEGCYDLQINQSLYQRSGEWTLSIDALATYYPASVALGDDGTSVHYGFDGVPEVLAEIRAVLEPGLAEYDIPLTDEGGSLKFSVRHDSGVDLSAIQELVSDASREETPGPWTFAFTVPPAS